MRGWWKEDLKFMEMFMFCFDMKIFQHVCLVVTILNRGGIIVRREVRGKVRMSNGVEVKHSKCRLSHVWRIQWSLGHPGLSLTWEQMTDVRDIETRSEANRNNAITCRLQYLMFVKHHSHTLRLDSATNSAFLLILSIWPTQDGKIEMHKGGGHF